MTNTLEMKDLLNLKLFEKITNIPTTYTFNYNNVIFFCVPRAQISQAIGRDASNVRRISAIAKKRIKILAIPDGEQDIKKFVEGIVSPITFTDLIIKDDEVILNAGPQNKASLLGRNKKRLEEMQKIISNYFNKGFKII